MDNFESKFQDACSNGNTKSCLEFLINHSKELDPKAINEKEILLLAVKNDYTEIATELLKLNLDVNIQNSKGETPLSIASKLGNLAIVNLLLENGAKINIKDSEYGETPLHKAVWNGNVEIVGKLLANGANGNIKDNQEGWTPLHVAVYTNNLKVIKKLLKYRAGIDVKDDEDESTPLHLAFEKAYDHGYSLCERQFVDVIEELLIGGSDPNLKMNFNNSFGYTPLQFVVDRTASRFYGMEDTKAWSSFNLILSHLIENGADLNKCDSGFDDPPIHIAISHENFFKKPVVLKRLLELEQEGCLDLNVRNYKLETLFESAIRNVCHLIGNTLDVGKMIIFQFHNS